MDFLKRITTIIPSEHADSGQKVDDTTPKMESPARHSLLEIQKSSHNPPGRTTKSALSKSMASATTSPMPPPGQSWIQESNVSHPLMNTRRRRGSSIIHKAAPSDPAHAPHLELPEPLATTKPVAIPDKARTRKRDAKSGDDALSLVWIRESPSSEPWDAAVLSTLSHPVRASLARSLKDSISAQIFDNKPRELSSEETTAAFRDENPERPATPASPPASRFNEGRTLSRETDTEEFNTRQYRPAARSGEEHALNALRRGERKGAGYDVQCSTSDSPLVNHPPLESPTVEFVNGYPTPINSRTNSQGLALPSPGSDKTATAVKVASTTSAQEFERRGWQIHRLPVSPPYFSHPKLRIVTDVNLRHLNALQTLCASLDHGTAALPPPGWELWIPTLAVSNTQPDRFPGQAWIHHGDRRISDTLPPPDDASFASETEEELEMERRYWAFVETHPAHFVLPGGAFSEAMDVLKWSYTDSLKSSGSPSAAAFTREECRELMAMLLSSEDGNRLTPTMRTRTVAGIFLRSCTSRLPRNGATGIRVRGFRLANPIIEKLARALPALDGHWGALLGGITLLPLVVILVPAIFAAWAAGKLSRRTVGIVLREPAADLIIVGYTR
ncbi:hypothetical protein OF83DRAFT_642465 [Amylostereum chailletii]|nr:hypothetical protein OF83DRAFT_642465 [Amylostereum chailletii]